MFQLFVWWVTFRKMMKPQASYKVVVVLDRYELKLNPSNIKFHCNPVTSLDMKLGDSWTDTTFQVCVHFMHLMLRVHTNSFNHSNSEMHMQTWADSPPPPHKTKKKFSYSAFKNIFSCKITVLCLYQRVEEIQSW